MKKFLNLSYGAIQGTYWMYYGVIMSFASIFLLGKNYTNSEIGIILATASILAVILQPLLADIADKSRKASLIFITGIISAGLLLATAFMYIFPTKSIMLSVIFVILGAWLTALQPLLNSMVFYLSRSGYVINFGITRSFGSVAYAGLCAILGSLVTIYGIKAVPTSGIVILLLFMFSLGITGSLYKKAIGSKLIDANVEKNVKNDAPIGLIDFVKRNKFFIVFTVGIVFLFFQNSVFNNYTMQIIAAVGGTSSQMGRLFSFMALLELPGLIFFSKLMKRFTLKFMIKISSVAFVFKVLLSLLATSVTFIYVAFLFQLISFPIFLSASVHLVDEVMEKGEAVKGQSFVTGMMTLSSVFASLLGGIILDLSGASLLLLISTVFAIIGTIIIVFTVDRIKPKYN